MAIKTRVFLFLFILLSCLKAEDLNVSIEYIKAYDENKTIPIPRTIKDDYLTCKTKMENAFVDIGGVDGFVVDRSYAIAFKKPKSYQVYNPFYKFYVVNVPDGFDEYTKAEDNASCMDNKIASMSKDELAYGDFMGFENGKGKTDFNMLKKSFIINPCCEVLGISINKKEFLPNSYLKTLVKRTSPYDGYIGANFYQKGERVYVLNVDFNLKNIHFCPKDEIISVDGMDIKSVSQLRRIILSSQNGDVLKVVVKRGGEYKTLDIESLHEPKYTINANSYLQKLGISFDRNLVIRKVYKNSFASKNGLKKGDKLMEINFKSVKNITQARNRFLYKKGENFHLLFSRKDFQFFVRFDRKDIKGGLIAIGFCPAI